MGTYKGNAKYYHSIGQNIMVTSSKYKYQNGRFGLNSPSTGNKTRNISSSNPVETAKDFYNKIAFGGIEKSYGNRKTTHMSDGTIVTWRQISSSDGTSVVEINISGSRNSSGVKEQKIHFIERGK